MDAEFFLKVCWVFHLKRTNCTIKFVGNVCIVIDLLASRTTLHSGHLYQSKISVLQKRSRHSFNVNGPSPNGIGIVRILNCSLCETLSEQFRQAVVTSMTP